MTSDATIEPTRPRPRKPGTVKERLGVLGVGLVGNQIIVWAFDYALYPYVVWLCGLLRGCVVMTFLSFLICYATIRFYDWAQRDWLGIEALKDVRETNSDNRLLRWFSALLQRSQWFALVFLSIKFDPFIVTAYMRHGSYQFNGLTRRDWRIFMASLFIANAYWSFVAFMGVSLFIWLWQYATNGT